MNLSFPDKKFDLILMTEVLEHIPNLDKAFDELTRVLKPDGRIILTIPILMNRKTRKCAMFDEQNNLQHILTPSYHGAPGENQDDMLVFHEFGSDVINMFEKRFCVSMHNQEELSFGVNTVFCLKI